ncbi:Leucine efflux protein [Pontiella desulfatans]|uniref:Leucine efflux protein n=1 Tax=Pontiella desulfatans TaxID=2750659 RepID=A0A6C2UAK5_PONDE|nr:LysE family transporter [Pontiella desulfatans]VGO17138.1 Leucine efflux protein [Pontiella desulfatans]
MFSLLTIFAGAFVVGLSGAMAPGPVLTVTISETLKRGFKAGPLIVLGHAVLEIMLLALIFAGLGPFFQHPVVTKVFLVAGGAVLLWMGGTMIIQNKKSTHDALNAKGAETPYGPIWAGIVLSVTNPYWIIWWVTIGMGFVTQSIQSGIAGLLSFYFGHILADLAWYSFVSFSVSVGRKLCPPMVYRVVFIVCGTVLIGLGGLFLSKSV